MSTANFAIMDELESQTSSTDSRSSPGYATQANSLEEKNDLKLNEDEIENNKNLNHYQFKTTDLDYKVVENDEDANFLMASTAVVVSPRSYSNHLFKTSEIEETQTTLLDTSTNSNKSENSFSFGKIKLSNELSDQAIKLDSDMENSFRRQSISARYLSYFFPHFKN